MFKSNISSLSIRTLVIQSLYFSMVFSNSSNSIITCVNLFDLFIFLSNILSILFTFSSPDTCEDMIFVICSLILCSSVRLFAIFSEISCIRFVSSASCRVRLPNVLPNEFSRSNNSFSNRLISSNSFSSARPVIELSQYDTNDLLILRCTNESTSFPSSIVGIS